jgi:hypothetical protein
MQQLSIDKPGSLKPLAGHTSKHKGKTLEDCFPDWTPEAIEIRKNGSGGETKADDVRPVEEYGAEIAVKEFPIEVRKAAISECEGGKDGWKALSWMERYNILNPPVSTFKADKEVKVKKKQSHKRH